MLDIQNDVLKIFNKSSDSFSNFKSINKFLNPKFTIDQIDVILSTELASIPMEILEVKSVLKRKSDYWSS